MRPVSQSTIRQSIQRRSGSTPPTPMNPRCPPCSVRCSETAGPAVERLEQPAGDQRVVLAVQDQRRHADAGDQPVAAGRRVVRLDGPEVPSRDGEPLVELPDAFRGAGREVAAGIGEARMPADVLREVPGEVPVVEPLDRTRQRVAAGREVDRGVHDGRPHDGVRHRGRIVPERPQRDVPAHRVADQPQRRAGAEPLHEPQRGEDVVRLPGVVRPGRERVPGAGAAVVEPERPHRRGPPASPPPAPDRRCNDTRPARAAARPRVGRAAIRPGGRRAGRRDRRRRAGRDAAPTAARTARRSPSGSSPAGSSPRSSAHARSAAADAAGTAGRPSPRRSCAVAGSRRVARLRCRFEEGAASLSDGGPARKRVFPSAATPPARTADLPVNLPNPPRPEPRSERLRGSACLPDRRRHLRHRPRRFRCGRWPMRPIGFPRGLRSRGRAVQVGPGRGQFAGALGGVLARDDLEHPQAAVRERERHARQVRGPQPVAFRADGRDRLGLPRREPAAPVPGRQGVVLPPVLDVVDLEPARLQRLDRVPDVVQLPRRGRCTWRSACARAAACRSGPCGASPAA